LGVNHPDTALGYYWIAYIYDNLGNRKEAKVFYIKALNIYEKILPDHSTTKAVRERLGNLQKK